MTSKLGDIYNEVNKQYKDCFPNSMKKDPAKVQQQFLAEWKKRVKDVVDKDEKMKAAEKFLKECQEKVTQIKAKRTINFFKVKPAKNKVATSSETLPTNNEGKSLSEDENTCTSSSTLMLEKVSDCQNSPSVETVCDTDTTSKKTYKKPAQEACIKEIERIKFELSKAEVLDKSGFSTDDSAKTVKKLKKDLQEQNSKLQQLQSNVIRQQKDRDKKANILKKISSENPQVAQELNIQDGPGRPRLETKQPGLLQAIVKIVSHVASTEARRRSEKLNSIQTLDDMCKELQTMNYTISKSALYLRLLPKRSNTAEAKRHVKTVPVRLIRAQNSLHKSHPDQYFCTASIRQIETLASILGPEQVIFLSQDDKARVPLGITAANKQSPILMHLEYEVRLPDHDWVVAERHKLISSVYALILIELNNMGTPTAVTFSGPTFIAIRSGKHSKSTASTHAADFEKLLQEDVFKKIMLNEAGNVKPVLILSVDGGPDENPRYPKVIKHAIDHFLKYDLDGLFIFTNAPGRSAFNRVERRMAPLSKHLSGVIVEHDHFGKHLDSNGKTIDVELEKKNFAYAGKVLGTLFSSVVIDGHEVIAKYIDPEEEEISVPDIPSDDWYAKHVRESQYLLQIVKCSDTECCKPTRSALKQVLKDGFLPAPFAIKQTPNSIEAVEISKDQRFTSLLLNGFINIKPNYDGIGEIPYDLYCPSVHDDLSSRICQICGLYFASKKNVKTHKQNVHGKSVSASKKIRPFRVVTRRGKELLVQKEVDAEIVEWVDEDNVEGIHAPVDDIQVDSLPEQNLHEWMQNPFEEEPSGST